MYVQRMYLNIGYWVGKLLMDFQDVAFLSFWARIYATFKKNCARGESLRTAVLKSVVGVIKGYAPCKIVLLQPISLCQLDWMEIITLLQNWC